MVVNNSINTSKLGTNDRTLLNNKNKANKSFFLTKFKPINNEEFYNIKLSSEIKHPQKIVDKLKNAINSNNWKKNLK